MSDAKTRDGDNAVAEALGRLAEGELGDDSIGSFVAACISQNYRDYAWTTTQLIDGLQDENAKLRAELAAVRSVISAACSQPWTPSTDYILRCLYPSQKMIDASREGDR